MDMDSFEIPPQPPQPVKRKSSILKAADKKRDSRTVSFSDRFIFKELHPDGTCDITNMFLQQDMDLTMVDIVENTVNVVTDMSMDELFTRYSLELSTSGESTLKEEDMIAREESIRMKDETRVAPTDESMVISEDGRRVSQESKTMEESMVISDISRLTSNDSIREISEETKFVYDDTKASEENISISEESNNNVGTQVAANETFYGAYHDSNLSLTSTNCTDQMYQNIEALDDCIHKIDQEVEENVRKLDEEMLELFKWYRHIVNKDNKYEFAVRIFGLRYGLWLIIKVDPETYPNQKLSLNFAVNKRDRHLYPFPEYAEAVKRFTKEGKPGYLTRFIFSAQKFRRFLRKSGFVHKDKYLNNKN